MTEYLAWKWIKHQLKLAEPVHIWWVYWGEYGWASGTWMYSRQEGIGSLDPIEDVIQND
jgi:hypothetical protein